VLYAGRADIELGVKIVYEGLHELMDRGKLILLLPRQGFGKALFCKQNSVIHEKKIEFRVKGLHVRGELESACHKVRPVK
jgi:hypothetical protein